MLELINRVYHFLRRRFFKMLNKIELNLFSKKPAAFNTKTLLLLRLDSIGDYVLFRNFMSEIKRSDKYRDYKIVGI